MKALTKRVISIALALCLCLIMLPTVTMQTMAATYDASKAVVYANAHWNDGKGLCAEFVSDCLAAGGISIPNSASYYSSSTQSYNNNSGTLGVYTNPYTCSASLLLYLSKSYTVITNPTSDQIAVGDVVFMYSGEWRDGHVGIVISTTGGTPVYAAHNRATNSGKFYSNYPCTYVVKMGGSHTCNKGTYVYYEAAHPHYKCYKCSICGSVWRNTAEPTTVSTCTSCVPTRTIDSRYSAYFPIAAYPISTGHISVYDEAGTIYSNRYIDGATDICIIWEIYTDGWCKVRYPSTAEASGYFDAYVPLSVFTASSAPASWTAENTYKTYKRSDMESSMHSVSSGATGLLLTTDGYLKQIIHPVSGQSYYMMGWIAEPKQIHSSATSLTLTLGGTSSRTLYAWSTGYYEGNTALYYSRSNSNISCSWGDWADGKAPLTITASSAGTTTLTIGVKDSDTNTVLDSMTVTITVDAKSYTVFYNANGGTGAPSSQTKTYGVNLTLSSTKPKRDGYTFLGWATSSTATTAAYQPGGSYTANSGTTLYAVWKKGCEAGAHSYNYTITTKPTASATGKLTGTCSKCSGTMTVTLPKLNTTDYSYKVTKAATCTAAGTGRYTWKTTTYGSFYFDVSIAKLGHSYTTKVTAPTCTAQGYTTHTCSRCSDSYKDTYTSATGHSYSYKASKAPTTSATGALTGTCSKCSGTTTVTLPKLNTTDYTYKVTKEPSYTATGIGRYTWKTTTYGSFYFDITLDKLTTNAKYSITSASGVVGSTVEVYVAIENNPGIISLRNTISYDTSALELIEVKDMGLLAGYTTPSATLTSPYTVRWADSLATANNMANGRIVKLTFKITDDAESGEYLVRVTHVESRNVSGSKVVFVEGSAYITVLDYLIGDVDNDGEVTDWDAILLNRYLAGWGTEINLHAADVDGDGEVSDWDAILLERYLAGWDVKLG